jgi:N-acetylmuramic acid 6-phosphate etherase
VASTEAVNPRFATIETWPLIDAVEAMLESQLTAVAAVRPAAADIAAAAAAAAQRLKLRGRLIYAGAGTSGRIAVQDGVELGPTFGWADDRLGFVIAGGLGALSHSAESAEDDPVEARTALAALGLNADDVVVGVAASGKTPFTIAALEEAQAVGALAVAISNNPGAPLFDAADHTILAETGAEAVAGSTRMKAGTAQKVILNLFSTGTMLALGRVYHGLMVDMVISNDKLAERAVNMVVDLAGCSTSAARRALADTRGDIKASVLIGLGASAESAKAALAASDGHLGPAMAALRQSGQ